MQRGWLLGARDELIQIIVIFRDCLENYQRWGGSHEAVMPDRLVAQLLDSSRADQAFPVAQAATGVSLERWRAFVAAQTAKSDGADGVGGILMAQDERGYIVGLCSFHRVEDMQRGPSLAVDNLIAVDLLDGSRVAEFLLINLETVARSRGLQAVQINLPRSAFAISPGRDGLVQSLCDRGHAIDSLRLVKTLDSGVGHAPLRRVSSR